jgi:hypothetical protein
MTESVKKNKEIRTNRYFWIACIVLVLLQYGLCIHYGLKRQYLFCDEVYSYGLANSTDKTFLHPGEDNTPLDEWVTGSYFENYMNYNDDSFNYSAAYRNQENDVHPPVYYMLLHTVCYFFKGAGYSAVPGIVLNLILLIFVDILLLYVAAYLLGNRWYGLMAAALWGVSSVGISNCMLIRMYLLQTLNVLLMTAVHVYILRHKKKMTVPYFILLALAVMFGGLTHYYFYFYVAGLGLCVCIYLLYMRKVKQMFAYGFSLVAGFGAAIAVFPATIKHIFGYRGSYATDNLIGLSGHKFLYYISYINRSYFAGLLPLIVLVALVLIVARIVLSFVDIRISLVRKNDGLSYRVCTHRRDIDADRTGRIESRSLLLAGVIVADAVLAFVGIQGSELVNARYIYSALPIVAVFMIWCMMKLVPVITRKRCAVVTAVICLALCAGSIAVKGVDWQYRGYSDWSTALEEMKGQDCIILCHGDGKWNNVYAGMNVFSQMGRCRYVYEDDIDSIADLVKDCGDEIYVAVINDPKIEKEKIHKMTEKIAEITKYTKKSIEYRFSGIRIYKFKAGETK